MANMRSATIRGKVARLTKVDSCGRVIASTKSTLVTDGFVKVSLALQWVEGTDTAVKNANGKLDVTDKPRDQLKRVDATIEFTRIDPEAKALVDGNPLILDANGDSVGFGVGTNDIESYFALEVWQDVTNVDCGPPGTPRPFYHYTVPFLGNGKIDGEVAMQEETASFTMKAETYAPNAWGAGPYKVDLSATSTQIGLFTPMDPREHFRGQRTLVAPPATTGGLVALTLP